MRGFAIVVFGVILCTSLATLCAAWTIVTLLRGEFLTALTVLGFAAMLIGLVANVTFAHSGKLTPRVEFDAAGTTIRRDRRVEIALLVSATGALTGMALFAVLAPLGKLDIPVPHALRYYLPAAGGFGAVSAGFFLWRSVTRRVETYVRLKAHGFEFAQGAKPAVGSWEEVEDVSDRPPSGPAPAGYPVVMVMRDGQTPTLAAGTFTPQGRARQDGAFLLEAPRESR